MALEQRQTVPPWQDPQWVSRFLLNLSDSETAFLSPTGYRELVSFFGITDVIDPGYSTRLKSSQLLHPRLLAT